MFIKSDILLAASLTTVISLFAADVTVTQQGKAFSHKKVELKVGQTLEFVNNDTVAHNVYTVLNGKKVDVGLQKVGEKDVITFDQAGRFRVRCAIHPKMKLTVTVK